MGLKSIPGVGKGFNWFNKDQILAAIWSEVLLRPMKALSWG